MQLCEEVADGLAARGHTIAILTSTCRRGDELERPYSVHRLLPLDPDWHSGWPIAWQFFVGRRARERRAVAALEHMVSQLDPDIIFVWHPIGLSRVMLQVAEDLANVTVIYYLADYWPELGDEHQAYWERPPLHWVRRWLKWPLSRIGLHLLAQEAKPIQLRFEHTICVSDYVRQRLVEREVIPPTAVTIHNGVDVREFAPRSGTGGDSTDGLRCLVAGRLLPEKGVHTVIEAFHLLKERGSLGDLDLTLLGHGESAYVEELQQRVAAYQLDAVVTFLPPVSRKRMPKVLADYDVLIAASEYEEPLARMVQEAMSCGLIVVGTVTGGSGEILTDGVNGLVFAAGDAMDLGGKLENLVQAPAQYRSDLASRARRTVEERFSILQTVLKIEEYLKESGFRERRGH